MHARLACTLAALLTVSACATEGVSVPGIPVAPAPAPTGSAAFRLSDFAWSTAPGQGRIDGQLAYRVRDTVHSCEKAGVLLTPETPWVRSRMSILYGTGEKVVLPAAEVRRRTPPERPDYARFVKRTSCDSAGRFQFGGLPDGTWYVITVAQPLPADAGVDVAIMRRVTIRGGKAVKVVL